MKAICFNTGGFFFSGALLSLIFASLQCLQINDGHKYTPEGLPPDVPGQRNG